MWIVTWDVDVYDDYDECNIVTQCRIFEEHKYAQEFIDFTAEGGNLENMKLYKAEEVPFKVTVSVE